jgi:tRNA uridine 5-carbamoylmethylation protein Kti12
MSEENKCTCGPMCSFCWAKINEAYDRIIAVNVKMDEANKKTSEMIKQITDRFKPPTEDTP